MLIGVPNHPKTRKLARRLGVTRPAAIGHLELLWHFTAEFFPSGLISNIDDPEDLADALMWDGDPGEIIEAMVAVGWLDIAATGRPLAGPWLVHDWSCHAPGYVHAKLARQLRHFADGTSPRVRKQDLNSDIRDKVEAFYAANPQIPHCFDGATRGHWPATGEPVEPRHATPRHVKPRQEEGVQRRGRARDPNPPPTGDDLPDLAQPLRLADALAQVMREVDPDCLRFDERRWPMVRETEARHLVELAGAGLNPQKVHRVIRGIYANRHRRGCGFTITCALDFAAKYDRMRVELDKIEAEAKAPRSSETDDPAARERAEIARLRANPGAV